MWIINIKLLTLMTISLFSEFSWKPAGNRQALWKSSTVSTTSSVHYQEPLQWVTGKLQTGAREVCLPNATDWYQRIRLILRAWTKADPRRKAWLEDQESGVLYMVGEEYKQARSNHAVLLRRQFKIPDNMNIGDWFSKLSLILVKPWVNFAFVCNIDWKIA